MNEKVLFKTRVTEIIYMISIYILILTTSILAFTGCKLNKKSKDSNGKIVINSEQRVDSVFSVSNFNGINVNSICKVIVIQDSIINSPIVKINSDKNFIKNVILLVENGILKIDYKEESSSDKDNMKNVIYVTINELTSLEVSGAASISSQGNITAKKLSLIMSGIGSIDVNCKTDSLLSEVSGTGKLEINGSTLNHKAEVSGIGGIEAKNLIAKNSNVQVIGAGGCEVFVTDSLIAEVSGIGGIKYYGNPKCIKKELSGFGSIEKDE